MGVTSTSSGISIRRTPGASPRWVSILLAIPAIISTAAVATTAKELGHVTIRPSALQALLLASLVAACQAAPAPSPTGPLPTQPPPTSTPSAAPASSTPGASTTRDAGWLADLAAIVPGLERIHPDPWHGIAKDAFEEALADL